MNNCEQKKLFREIQIYSFAVLECALYLDGHPDNKRAMEFYKKYNAKLTELNKKYEKNYGPLTIFGNEECTWTWTESAWPWHYDSL